MHRLTSWQPQWSAWDQTGELGCLATSSALASVSCYFSTCSQHQRHVRSKAEATPCTLLQVSGSGSAGEVHLPLLYATCVSNITFLYDRNQEQADGHSPAEGQTEQPPRAEISPIALPVRQQRSAAEVGPPREPPVEQESTSSSHREERFNLLPQGEHTAAVLQAELPPSQAGCTCDRTAAALSCI